MKRERARRVILAIFGSQEQRKSLESILAVKGYTVRRAASVDVLPSALSQERVGVVVCESRLPDGRSWRDALVQLREVDDCARLIVADRLADEVLWSEILNLGAYDLLAEPFDPTEVARVVELAWESWRGRLDLPKLHRRAVTASSQ